MKRIVSFILAITMLVLSCPRSILAIENNIIYTSESEDGEEIVAEDYSLEDKDLLEKSQEKHTYMDTWTFIFKFKDKEVDRQIIASDSDALHAPATPKEENNKFLGWYYKDGEEEKRLDFDELNENKDVGNEFSYKISDNSNSHEIEVYAKFENIYYVRFIYNGNILETREVKANEKVSKGGIPYLISEEGKAFSHWSESENGEKFDFNKAITKDTDLYLVTKAAHKLTFDSKGGSAVLPMYVESGEKVGELPTPTKKGYTFVCWSCDEKYQKGQTDFEKGDVVSSEKTLYAMWAKSETKYTIVHWQENAEDDNYTVKEVEQKEGITGEKAKVEAKAYEGFEKNEEKTKEDEDKTISGLGDTVVNVYYKRKKYKFTMERKKTGSLYNSRAKRSIVTYGYEQIAEKEFKYGQSTKSIYEEKAKENPNHSWYTARNSNTAYSQAPTMPNNNLSVYGEVRGTQKHMIQYYERNHGQIRPPYVFNTQARVMFSKEDGINIEGFTVEEQKRWTEFAMGTDNIRRGSIYYDRNKYNITFNTNNANNEVKTLSDIPFEEKLDDKDKQSGLELGKSTKTIDGITYYFEGWYENSAFVGNAFTFKDKKMPAHNLNLYAKWTAEKYTVKFHSNREKTSDILKETKDIVAGTTITKPDDLEKDTWYWYLQETFVPFNFETPITGNFDLYSVNDNKTVKIEYDLDGASGTAPTDAMSGKYLEGTFAKVLDIGSGTKKDNKVFIAWQDKEENRMYYAGDKILLNKDKKLTAYFGDIPTKVNIIYKAGKLGTGADITEKDKLIYQNINLPENKFTPKDSSYEFIGWKSSLDNKIYEAGAKAQVSSQSEKNIFTAYWLKKIDIEKVWVGGENNRPKNIKIHVKRDGNDFEREHIELISADSTKKILDLPSSIIILGEGETKAGILVNSLKADESEYSYTVDEENVENFEKSIDGFKITNTYKAPKLEPKKPEAKEEEPQKPQPEEPKQEEPQKPQPEEPKYENPKEEQKTEKPSPEIPKKEEKVEEEPKNTPKDSPNEGGDINSPNTNSFARKRSGGGAYYIRKNNQKVDKTTEVVNIVPENEEKNIIEDSEDIENPKIIKKSRIPKTSDEAPILKLVLLIIFSLISLLAFIKLRCTDEDKRDNKKE